MTDLTIPGILMSGILALATAVAKQWLAAREHAKELAEVHKSYAEKLEKAHQETKAAMLEHSKNLELYLRVLERTRSKNSTPPPSQR